MRICADEHVSPEIVRLVHEIALSPGWELSHVFDGGWGGTDDVVWITRFARNGGQALLTADKDFIKRHHQVLAVCDTGLRVVHMPKKWANERRRMQAAHILFWWNQIEAALSNSAPRQCYKVPWSFTDSSLGPIKLDFENARRKIKKAERRA